MKGTHLLDAMALLQNYILKTIIQWTGIASAYVMLIKTSLLLIC